MKIYEVKSKSGNSEHVMTVLAKDMTQAVEHATRYNKANYYSREIIAIEKVLTVDVIYKK